MNPKKPSRQKRFRPEIETTRGIHGLEKDPEAEEKENLEEKTSGSEPEPEPKFLGDYRRKKWFCFLIVFEDVLPPTFMEFVAFFCGFCFTLQLQYNTLVNKTMLYISKAKFRKNTWVRESGVV